RAAHMRSIPPTHARIGLTPKWAPTSPSIASSRMEAGWQSPTSTRQIRLHRQRHLARRRRYRIHKFASAFSGVRFRLTHADFLERRADRAGDKGCKDLRRGPNARQGTHDTIAQPRQGHAVALIDWREEKTGALIEPYMKRAHALV